MIYRKINNKNVLLAAEVCVDTEECVTSAGLLLLGGDDEPNIHSHNIVFSERSTGINQLDKYYASDIHLVTAIHLNLHTSSYVYSV